MGKKLHIGNLSYNATEEDLKEVFASVGTCESVAVIMDRATGQSRGFGFVEMSSDEEAQRAIEELNGREVRGRAIKVSEAREREGGGGGRGGPRGGWQRR
jgi:cold-inducible RNA-binding protein